MPTLADLIFYALVAWMFCHELDAIQRHEWRIFPVLRGWPEGLAYRAFVAAHVPLLIIILVALHDAGFRVGFAAFSIVHVGLHWLLRHHPRYEFNNRFSHLWIAGAGLLGGLYLLARVFLM